MGGVPPIYIPLFFGLKIISPFHLEMDFLATLPVETAERIATFKEYSKFGQSDIDYALTELSRLDKDYKKLLQERKIIQEQESSQVINYEKEEKALKWNEDGLVKAQGDTSAIRYFEQQLEAAKRAYQKNIDFWESRVAVSKAELENKRTKVSRPLVKVNVKIEDMEKKMSAHQNLINGVDGWKKVKEEMELAKKMFRKTKPVLPPPPVLPSPPISQGPKEKRKPRTVKATLPAPILEDISNQSIG